MNFNRQNIRGAQITNQCGLHAAIMRRQHSAIMGCARGRARMDCAHNYTHTPTHSVKQTCRSLGRSSDGIKGVNLVKKIGVFIKFSGLTTTGELKSSVSRRYNTTVHALTHIYFKLVDSL